MSDQGAIEVVLSYLVHVHSLGALKQSSPEYYQLIGLGISEKLDALGRDRLKAAIDCLANELEQVRIVSGYLDTQGE